MRVEALTSWDAFAALQPEWNDLLARSAADSVFLTFEWMDAFRQTVSDRILPLIITVRSDGGRLLGIAPFWRSQFTFLGVFKFKVLRFMGDTQTGQEYPDLIVDPQHEQQICAQIWAYLAGETSYDLIWLPRVAGWTGAADRLGGAAMESGCLVHQRNTAFSAMQLPRTLAEFEAGFSANRRQQIRRNSRKVLSAVTLDFHVVETESELAPALDALFSLHQARWQAAGSDGAFVRRPAMRKFYRQFAERALANQWLRLYQYVSGQSPKAAIIGFVYRNVYHQMQEGYDPAAVDGIGNALRHRSIVHAIEEAVESYDFLGGESEHKRRWGAKTRQGNDVLIGRSTLMNRLFFLRDIWPSGRLISDHSVALVESAASHND